VPRLTLSNEQLMIYDDFLPKDLFESLLIHANNDAYAMVHRQEWRKVWRLGDGLPLQGTTTYYRDDASVYEDDEKPRYPTQSPLDRFFDALNDTVAGAENLVGKRGVAWTSISVAPWIYPPGSGLSLHRDHYHCSGSFTYFVHRDWNFHWGGQLLVLDPKTGRGAPDLDQSALSWPFLSDEEESAIAAEPGLATCVLPKPNRLVFIGRSVFHLITRVDANAGNRARVAFAGFFMLPKQTASTTE
jgi:hypothetical protein